MSIIDRPAVNSAAPVDLAPRPTKPGRVVPRIPVAPTVPARASRDDVSAPRTPSVTTAPIPAPRGESVVPRTVVTPVTTKTLERRQRWERQYRLRLALTDTAVVLGATGVAAWVQIATIAQVDVADAPWQYTRVFLLTATIWILLLALFQTRSTKIFGQGMTEYRRVLHATGLAFGILAIAFVVMQSQGIRTQILIALPLGIIGLLAGRLAWRRWLQRKRAVGAFASRTLVAGNRHDVEYVISTLRASGQSAYHVIGVTIDGCSDDAVTLDGTTYSACGTMHSVAQSAVQLGADAVILATTPESDRSYIKTLTWQLEGTAAELVLSSPLVDVAGPRMSLKPMEGLPLIQVAIPTFEGGRHLIKRVIDIAFSSLALLVVLVALPFIALAIKLDDGGPVFFRQRRVGRDGREFFMLKFRSMRVDAEKQLAALQAQNESGGPLFKMKSDPRITRVGAFLRKYSIDEFPQFWNVFVGDMSLVGPRPPLPAETHKYGGTVYRRLYINPGITGPWQTSGRSNLSWEESVRLDLRYVENWSVLGDFVLLWRTIGSVLKAEGAY